MLEGREQDLYLQLELSGMWNSPDRYISTTEGKFSDVMVRENLIRRCVYSIQLYGILYHHPWVSVEEVLCRIARKELIT